MNYQKIYDQICQRSKAEVDYRVKRKKLGEAYYEGHHIVPESMGGLGKSDQYYHPNIAILTAREHFLCHWLLHEIYPKNHKLAYAFSKMCHIKSTSAKNYVPNSRVVEYARKKMAQLNTGENNPFYNKKHSKEVIDRIKAKLANFKHSEESKLKMGRSRYGKDNSQFGKPSTKRKKVIDIENSIIFDSLKHAGEHYGITSAAIIYRIKTGKLSYYKI